MPRWAGRIEEECSPSTQPVGRLGRRMWMWMSGCQFQRLLHRVHMRHKWHKKTSLKEDDDHRGDVEDAEDAAAAAGEM